MSTLEMVLVFPTLLLLVFGGVELSRAWLTLDLVTAAAREAARAASVAPAEQFPTPPAAQQRLDEILGAGRWTGQVTCATAPCTPDAQVRASVTVTFSTVVPVLLPMLSSLSIQQTAVMRYE